MWRTQAIVSMLLEEVGGLPADDDGALSRALRRGAWIVAIDWLAVIVLVLLQDGDAAQLKLSGGEQAVFTVGILAVAAHSGFRLGQLQKLKSLQRLRAELEERGAE
ncbi:MAG: hypothetical protein O7A98_11540 [Acidobacteria bacterium]|nr:hypothetical protein [Acidobacteriota bacterium]MCZ6727971.1 hypothetical protein [Acidobacteriota bacterium]